MGDTMNSPAKNTRCTSIPALRYRDPAAMVDWLCSHFGFERHLVVAGAGGAGGVEHAQLSFGNGMVMLGPVRNDQFGRLMAQPGELGGRETQSAYLVCDDPDALHARALAAGAQIVMPLQDEDYGGRGFSCRDPEGHIWNFGNYDPWTDNDK
jgi:uncharacterized glyoxalase superfamily protein PhnB